MNLTLKSTTALALALSLTGGAALAGMDEARAFLDAEIGDMSVLTREEQEAEMQWFIDSYLAYGVTPNRAEMAGAIFKFRA